ncbi:MAG: site-specific integrase [Advenella sp.]|uniref:site-specific integrase n=1 Tax=Advenella sp. TaxID=1872388 RepID=UPI00258650FE|nr:site-specific integrase [Advenella sp.]MDD3758108.1 site-specific integrase [Advenella sp.]
MAGFFVRNRKPQEKLYKVNDRDGLYAAVTPAGAISFRYSYSIHGRQETITFGRYGLGGITLAEARELVLQIFRWAIERGQKVDNPAELVRPASIARFEPRDRALTPEEIGLMYQYIERIGTSPSIRAAAKLLLLTMVRKSELTNATWSEINFTEALWTIPKERMKRRNPHLVFLSRQALDIFIALKTFAGGSEYVLPSRYDTDKPMSSATLNQVLTLTYRLAQKEGQPLAKFGPHDLRRTASTLLHEAGYNTDWIEKCLAHEQRGVRAVYNKAEYREQRAEMLQDWADMIDGWAAGKVLTVH